MNRTLAELTKDCKKRNIALNPGQKYGRQDLVDLLAAQSIQKLGEEHISWGLRMRMQMVTPMLCFSWKHLKPQQQVDANQDGGDWIVEQKFDGCRLVACYHPDEGFSFWSRNISVEDYLPVEYTDQLLLIKDGVIRKARDIKGSGVPFMIDCEVLCDNKSIDTTLFASKGVVTGTELNAVSALLALNQEDSHKIQMTQAALRLVAFDCMYFKENWITGQLLEQRKVVLGRICEVLAASLPITESMWVDKGKEKFYQDQVSKGCEGVVYKNIKMPYVATTSRRRDTQVKRKRSVAESMGSDIDAFISGYIEADENKAWKDMIGAVKLSVLLTNGDQGREHWIASISGLPLELRKAMSEMGPDGKPRLKEEYYGKVLTINGQDLSAKAKRFCHATCPNWNFRTDKSKHECLMEEEFLDSQVL